MIDITWISGVMAGAICLGAGILGVMKSRDSPPAKMFLCAMIFMCLAMSTGWIYAVASQGSQLGDVLLKLHLTALLVALAFILNLSLIFPAERTFGFRPMTKLGAVMVLPLLGAMIGLLATTQPTVITVMQPQAPSELSKIIQGTGTLFYIVLASAVVFVSNPRAGREAMRSAWMFVLGLWTWAVTGTLHAFIAESWSFLVFSGGVAVSGLFFAIAIASGRMVMATPAAERMVSSSKSHYNLLRRNVYLVNEPKADFAFKMFTDIVKGRCYDCVSDESFACESINCDTCKLPCPCHGCAKYKSRAQGFVVTRRYPNEIRKTYYVQTTPILWLTTVAGPENMDPAKLNMLTDYIVSFMEKSQNGVVLIDGLEYLVTSNDFQRVLKAVDRWTEVAMTSNVRLIISIDGRAFDPKELALLEASRNVVRPDAREHWRIIPERI